MCARYIGMHSIRMKHRLMLNQLVAVSTTGAKEQTLTSYQERSADAGGGSRAQELRLQQAMRESHGRRMQALQEHKSKRSAGSSSTNSSSENSDVLEFR